MATQATRIAVKTQEEYTITWTIAHILSALQSRLGLIFETIQFDLGSPDTKSKWKVSFALGASQTLVIKMQMLERQPSISVSSVQGKIEWISAGVFQVCQQLGKFETRDPFVLGENKVFETGLLLAPDQPQWRNLYVMSGDSFSVKITLKILLSDSTPIDYTTTTETKFVKSSLENLQKSLVKLCANKELADLKILCIDGKEFAAHKLVLRARNPVFDAMLGTEMLEGNSGAIKVDDLTGETMRILLHFIYSGELLDEWRKPEVIHEFVYAAGKYQLDEVLEMLDEVLGTEKVATCDVRLLSLTNKLGLKNADARIATRLGKLFSQVKTGDEMMKLLAK